MFADKVAAAIPKHQEEQQALSATRQRARQAPTAASRSTSTAAVADFELITIIGIVVEGVGRPRNVGSRGSALYRIPLRLSRMPSRVWASHFVETWNHPPRFTTMHRPGIASVSGDTVILDGTTMEELESVHVETLRYVLGKVNADVGEHERNERACAEREAEARRQHEQTVKEASARLKFK